MFEDIVSLVFGIMFILILLFMIFYLFAYASKCDKVDKDYISKLSDTDKCIINDYKMNVKVPFLDVFKKSKKKDNGGEINEN